MPGYFALTAANAVRRKSEHTAPQAWPPPFSYAELRRASASALPGARVRRLLLGRWLLTWQAPPV